VRRAGIAAAIPKETRLADLAQAFLKRLPAAEYPYFYEHVEQHLKKSVRDGKSTFEFGLDLILDGLERIRGAESRRSVSTRRRTNRSTRGSTRPRRRRR
jgi:hypothetical protein